MMTWKYLVSIISIAAVFASCGSGNTDLLKYRILESSSAIEDTAYYSIKLEYPVFIANNEADPSLDKLNNAIGQFLDTAAAYYWGMEPGFCKFVIDETNAAGACFG